MDNQLLSTLKKLRMSGLASTLESFMPSAGIQRDSLRYDCLIPIDLRHSARLLT